MNLSSNIVSSPKPFIIAGPCSAESESQINLICESLAQTGIVQLFRAGIWKPRTRPNSFEGLGEIALPWLVNASQRFNIPCSVEVANGKHVEAAIEAGVDVLWIGARTTVNPFAVQEIADALQGVKMPVMVKNPINPDLQLWLGAFERLRNAGMNDLVAVHRGFSIYNHPKYRNVPNWEIPIAFREEFPDIPMICDPSHISGRRDLLQEVSQKAMDLDFDGLMIETHPNPDQAWSDAAQQVTANQFSQIIERLVLRSKDVANDAVDVLEDLREKIENLDDRLFDLLSARMQLSEEVGQLKREKNITILQQEHWKKIIQGRIDKKDDYQLSRHFIRQLMDAIHQESIRHQTRVMNNPPSNS